MQERGCVVADVLGDRRSLPPLAGWLLSGLLGLVGWLTVVYAPGAFERAKLAHGADPKGVITVEAGYITILAVAQAWRGAAWRNPLWQSLPFCVSMICIMSMPSTKTLNKEGKA